jgi:hypothetical protein
MECVMSKRCKACGQLFQPHPQVPSQTYCSAPECQRERRRLWQQKKRREDPHYRENGSDYSKVWSAGNTGYWKRYRETHPDYADRNRSLQQNRNQLLRQAEIAKVDASTVIIPFQSGRYRLVHIAADGIANEDVWIVEITVISVSCEDSGADCKVKT